MNEFFVRKYQQPLFSSWTGVGPGGSKAPRKDRLVEIAHRRWGKDEIALRATLVCMIERPASYWHCLPLYEQGRKALWTSVNPHTGKLRIEEAFPDELVESRNEQEMFLRLRNGATWQIVGSDRYNSLVGAGVAGITFSEWALANPSAWGYMRPMVEENRGWAAFITTPRGDNHAKATYDRALKSDRWFAEVSGVHQTGALTSEEIEEALDDYIALYGEDFGRGLFDQEYHCSFVGAVIGAYFGAEVSRAEREGRVREVEIDSEYPVHTAWDLGKASNNPIWCFQVIKGEPRIVDFYEPDSENLEDWVAWLNKRGYNGTDYVPHDIIVTEWGTNRSRFDVLKSHGRKPRRIPMASIADGLQAARMTINKATFREHPRVRRGIEGLKNYRREWDEDRKVFREHAYKDWSEHIGSAFRYLGLAWRDEEVKALPQKAPTTLDYEVKDGKAVMNMTIQEIVAQRVKKRRRSK